MWTDCIKTAGICESKWGETCRRKHNLFISWTLETYSTYLFWSECPESDLKPCSDCCHTYKSRHSLSHKYVIDSIIISYERGNPERLGRTTNESKGQRYHQRHNHMQDTNGKMVVKNFVSCLFFPFSLSSCLHFAQDPYRIRLVPLKIKTISKTLTSVDFTRWVHLI